MSKSLAESLPLLCQDSSGRAASDFQDVPRIPHNPHVNPRASTVCCLARILPAAPLTLGPRWSNGTRPILTTPADSHGADCFRTLAHRNGIYSRRVAPAVDPPCMNAWVGGGARSHTGTLTAIRFNPPGSGV